MTEGCPHLVWKWPYLTAIIEHGYGGSGVNVPIQNPRLFQKSASKRVKNLHFGVPMSYLCRSNSAWRSRKSGRSEWKTRILIYINPKSTSLYYIGCSQEHSKVSFQLLKRFWVTGYPQNDLAMLGKCSEVAFTLNRPAVGYKNAMRHFQSRSVMAENFNKGGKLCPIKKARK